MESVQHINQIPLSPEDNPMFNYEWDVFDQCMDWSNRDYLDWVSESVLSTCPSSPADRSSPLSRTSYSQPRSPRSSISRDFSSSASPTSNPRPAQAGPRKPKPNRRQPSPDSLARRRSQNRESQRAFRSRKQQQVEGMNVELQTMSRMYEGLKEKYEDLSGLYIALLKVHRSAGQVGQMSGDEMNGELFLADYGWRDLEGGDEYKMDILGQEFDAGDLLFGEGMMPLDGSRIGLF